VKASDQLLKRINPLVIALLKSRLHGLMSKDVMLITVTGRRSGRSYTRPVSYAREDQTVRCFSRNDTAWWKNLRGGGRVSLRVRGEALQGDAEVISEDPKRIADALTAFLARVPRDAAYYDITLDASKTPDPADLERAAQQVILVEIALDRSD